MSSDDLVVANASPSQRLLLGRIARCSISLMMRAALILDGMARPKILVHKQQIDPFRIDAAIGVTVLAPQNFTQRDLRHHLPSRIAAHHDAIELLEHTRLALVEERPDPKVALITIRS